MDKQLALGRRVVARMRELGIAPVYPAFAGAAARGCCMLVLPLGGSTFASMLLLLACIKCVVQQRISHACTLLHMQPPGFIPRALAAAHPGAAVTRASRWCRFAEPFCCPLMLDPQDPLFAAVGGAFVRRLRASFGPEPEGRPSYYTADR